jgi:transcriptional regulator with XRE-family HTH domain
MKGYDIFEQIVTPEIKDYFNEDLAQTTALLEASDLIYSAMEEKGLNQSQLAEKMGVSRGYISRILSGNENMSIKNVAKVLHVLGKRYIQNVKNMISDDGKCIVYDYATYKNGSIRAHVEEQDPSTNNLWKSAASHG